MNDNYKCELCGEMITSEYDGNGIAEMGPPIDDTVSVEMYGSVICHYTCGQAKGYELA